MNVESLHDLFEVELRKVYSAESELVDELAVLADDAAADSLDDTRMREVHEAFQDLVRTHREETEEHVQRLEDAFDALDLRPEERSIPALEGLIKEKELFNNVVLNDGVRPVYYLGVARNVEQLELTAYDRLLRIAAHLNLPQEVTEALAANREAEADALRAIESLAEGEDVESLLEAMAGSQPLE
ncbi:hypothetical protein BRC81_01245 [Halobacteriales archaeon QS_1_68_20]|nr:MAG: hypothetical protein BRC81_01245 [Halobacteriales archaeon QS_1_68_20]